MEKKIIKYLNIYYYGILCCMIIIASLSYFLIAHQYVSLIAPQSTLGKAIQYFVIFDMLITVPIGLWWHKRQCKPISTIEDNYLRLKSYRKSAVLRIVLVSNTMLFALPAFYFLGAYMSMIWVAAISAVGWYFTKPSEKKMYFELHPNEEQY